MAGRGTDIMLGGNPEFLADVELRTRGLDPVETPEEYEAGWDEVVAAMKGQVAAEAEKVKDAGGLYVLGTERHESRRIDNQLRGRSGRQGDPGESRFYLSLGDELMRRFNGAAVESIMTRLKLPDDVPIEAGMVTKAIRSAQTQVEQQNFEIRKNVLKYDEVINKQRTVIYDERRRVLAGEDIQEQIENMFTDVVTAYVDGETADGYAEDWDLDKLWTALRTLYPVGISKQEITGEDGDAPVDLTRDELLAAVLADARTAYAQREAEIDELLAVQGGMRELERQMLLQVMDRKWREHLYEMDYLKEGIGLRAMAQRDPLIEYQREGFDMFTAMLDGIKEETVSLLFNVQVQVVPAEPVANGAEPEAVTAPQEAAIEARRARACAGARSRGHGGPACGVPGAAPTELSYSGPSEDGSTTRSRPSGNGRAGTPAQGGHAVEQPALPLRLGAQVQAVPRLADGGPPLVRSSDQLQERARPRRAVPLEAGGERAHPAVDAAHRRHLGGLGVRQAQPSRSTRDTADGAPAGSRARHRPSVPGSRRLASCSGGRLPSNTSTASRRVVPTERRTPTVSTGGRHERLRRRDDAAHDDGPDAGASAHSEGGTAGVGSRVRASLAVRPVVGGESPKKASSPAMSAAQAGMLVGAERGIDGARRQHIDAAHRHALGRVGVGLDRQGDEVDVEKLGQLVGHDMDHLLEGRAPG